MSTKKKKMIRSNSHRDKMEIVHTVGTAESPRCSVIRGSQRDTDLFRRLEIG